ncbi:MAG TPA: hypothetical protein H9999_03815, partial [Candidatus Negativibacillus faecipullorum]|nr:hypothetical protein [Candidatus Negativibacillus faecipullorum]
MPQTEAVCGKEFVERRLYLLFKFIIIYLYNIFNSFVRKDFGKKTGNFAPAGTAILRNRRLSRGKEGLCEQHFTPWDAR